MASRRMVVAAAVLTGVVCLSAGAVVGFVLVPAPVPDIVQSKPGQSVVDVVPQSFADERTLSATPSLSQRQEFTSAASGVVRAVQCTVGNEIASGTSVFTVDDRVVVALHLDTPPWRDLTVGAKGADVSDFQRELTRLGYPTAESGTYTADTAAAAKKFWATAGVANQTDLPLDRVVWLPKESVTPSECLTVVGVSRASGDPVMAEGGQLTGLMVTIPDSATSGQRLASQGDVATPIADDGTVTDPSFLEAFTHSLSYIQWLPTQSGPLTVSTKLATPIQVVTVSPSSLYQVTGNMGCLINEDSKPVRVQIVASQLGETFVSADPLPSSVTVPAPEGATTCA